MVAREASLKTRPRLCPQCKDEDAEVGREKKRDPDLEESGEGQGGGGMIGDLKVLNGEE